MKNFKKFNEDNGLENNHLDKKVESVANSKHEGWKEGDKVTYNRDVEVVYNHTMDELRISNGGNKIKGINSNNVFKKIK